MRAGQTQLSWIEAALKRGPLTPIEALHGCGCFRLAARIKDLRAAGVQITTEDYELANGKRVARYHLTSTTKKTAA